MGPCTCARFPSGGLFGSSIGDDDVGPGSYDSFLGQSCFSAASTLSPRCGTLNSSAFGIGEKKSVSRREPQEDNEDARASTWSIERDREQFWTTHVPKWSTTEVERGAQADKSDGPDIIMYDIDQTRQVTKYQPLATLAGCKDLPRLKKKSVSCPSLLSTKSSPISNVDLSALGITEFDSVNWPMIDRCVASSRRSARPTSKQQQSLPTPMNQLASPPGTAGSVLSATPTTFPDAFSPHSLVATPKMSPQAQHGYGQVASRMQVQCSFAVRLFDNKIASLDGMIPFLERITRNNCEGVKTLDLSFNQIFSLKLEDLSALPCLSTLNLCSNDISSFRSIKQLVSMTSLRALNLIDNPIQSCNNYRTKVIGLMPFLKKLDNSVITKIEYHLASLWFAKTKAGKMQQRQ
jgi:hypothetical protein